MRKARNIDKSLDEFANDFGELKNGKDAEGERVPLSERLHADRNLIDDQRWPFQSPEDDFPAGRERYQEHTRNLLKAVGCRDALITNLLFLQAARPNDIHGQLNGKHKDFEGAYLRVHDLIFEMTKAVPGGCPVPNRQHFMERPL